ncbi:MAG TPA: FtsH protease activity modulator HflK [Polyangiales bacterium]|nr:FtsH protease activity modulator HflK [Polyangiales bacterium]
MPPPKRGPEPNDFGALGDALARLWRSFASQLGLFMVLAIVLLSALTSYYQVEPEEVALVTRFGRYISTEQPGPHFKWPLGIDSAIKVPVQRQLKEEFGFRTTRAGVSSEFAQEGQDSSKESSMLTGDLNVANVEWIVQYKVKDPYQFVFRVRNVRGTLRDVSEAVMRKVVGDHSVTEVLTVGREAIQQQAKDEMQVLCNHYQMGIEVLQLVLQDVNPPERVRESFNEVNQAIQEREREINEAWAGYNSKVPEAEGRALQMVSAAEGYSLERVNNARGEVQRFLSIESEYRKAPAVTRARLYLENVDKVLPKAQRKVIIDDSIKGVLPLFGLTNTGAKKP